MPDAGKLQLTEGDAPATPSAGSLRVYAKTDHELYVKDPNGNERGLGTSGTSYFASSAGNAGTSSYATTAGNSGSASSATTAAQSGTASYATTSGQSGTSSYSTTAGQSGTAVKASSAGESGSAGSATTAANAGSASYATTSGQAGTSSYSTTTGQAGTSVLATSAGNAGSASSATTSGQAGTSSYATTSGQSGTATYSTTTGQAGTSAFATTASVCGTLGSNGALGTPSSGDLSACTGLPSDTGVTATWTTPAFNAANFTASGSQTWTVEEADVSVYTYNITGKMMTVAFTIATTTVGGTPSDRLFIKIPASKTATKAIWNACLVYQGSWVSSKCYVAAGTTNITVYANPTEPNWAASTDGTYVQGQITFEIN